MPTLRNMIDGRTVTAAVAPPPAKPKSTGQPSGKKSMSPGAQHVTDHLNDTLGMTKPGFTDLTKKKLDYDQARENMQRELAAPQAVIDHLSNIHGLVPGGMPGQLPTPGMTPNAPGQDPNAMGTDGEQGYDDQGNPTPGAPGQGTNPMEQMNNGRPSQVGTQPGVAPGAQNTVVPGKMGVPKPGAGGGTAAGQPTKPPNAQRAAPPKGAGKLPGAKGPGDSKVANKNKAAQSGTTGRQVKISVNATQAPGASRTVASSRGMAALKFGTTHTPGEIKAGPSELSDKATDPGDEVAYNPTMKAHGKDCKCAGCSKRKMDAGGPGSGRRKELESLQRQAEDSAHQATTAQERQRWQQQAEQHQRELNKLQAGGPGSGRHPGGMSKEKGINHTPLHSFAHKILVKQGYRYQGNTSGRKNVNGLGTSEYTHPSGKTVSTYADGSWETKEDDGNLDQYKSSVNDFNRAIKASRY